MKKIHVVATQHGRELDPFVVIQCERLTDRDLTKAIETLNRIHGYNIYINTKWQS